MDPRRSGSVEGGENFIITRKELRLSLQAQCKEEDQVVWMTTVQNDFPTTDAEGELDNDLDRQRGKLTARCLHPAISVFILQRQQERSTEDQAPSMTESRTLELESEWGTQETHMEISWRFQLQQKSLMILGDNSQGSDLGLTTMITKIQDSCKTQESLEEANVFFPTRHLLLTIKRLWQIDRVHGLPAVTAPRLTGDPP